MIEIRQATENDASELLDIYAPYITDTTITFEDVIPTIEDFKQRIRDISAKFPYLVAIDENNKILGYAYAHSYKPRAAYEWTVEVSIYIDQNYKGHGLGTKLYHHLERLLKQQGVVNLMARITQENAASIRFHKKLGYQETGVFHKVGFKFNRWLDITWMEKSLNPHVEKIQKLIPYK